LTAVNLWFILSEFGNEAKHTFIDKVFGGVFISSVLCHVCHVVCITVYLVVIVYWVIY